MGEIVHGSFFGGFLPQNCFPHKLFLHYLRTSEKMKFYNDILGLIGNTPLVRINHITKQHKIKATILAKMESLNPGYSVKDRIGVSMIDMAEKEGVLKKGGTIIEATSGNTGIGLALVAAVRGYKCIFVLTDKVSVEKVRYLKSMGADVVVVPAAAKSGTPDHYHETRTKEINYVHAEIVTPYRNYFHFDRCRNPRRQCVGRLRLRLS